MNDFFCDAQRNSLVSQSFDVCQKFFTEYVNFVQQESNSSYFGMIKQTMIQTKFEEMTLCQIQFVADCASPLDAAPTVIQNFCKEKSIIYITMGNDTWDHFASHSDFWIARFLQSFQERFEVLCQEQGWKGKCRKTYQKHDTGTIELSCTIRFV